MEIKSKKEKYKQLRVEDRNLIFSFLAKGLNLTQCATSLGLDISTLKREIDRNKILVENGKYRNRCGWKHQCNEMHVCGNTRCTHLCNDCRRGFRCNEKCRMFTPEPKCKKLKKLCGVCNGCDEKDKCSLNKYIYDPQKADKRYQNKLTEAHKGVRLSDKELKEYTEFLKPLILKGLSLEVIKSQYPTQFNYSVQTVYNWINSGLLPGILNLDLPRKVRYAKRSKKKNDVIEREYLSKRTYQDFIAYTTENPYDEVVEMDTVEGTGKNSFLLTLLFRRSNFMMAFILRDHTSQAVIEVFDKIKKYLGNDLFSRTFKVILTDRGSEFTEPLEIEVDKKTNKVLTHVFYCDARQSQQKGKIEKNHVELRKLFPKGSIGSNFNNLTQEYLNKCMSMINSYPRPSLNFKCPHDIFASYSDERVLKMVQAQKIPFDQINLKIVRG